MTIPKDCLISLETVIYTNYGNIIKDIMYKELNSPKYCLLSSFLLYEEKNKKYNIILTYYQRNIVIFQYFIKK